MSALSPKKLALGIAFLGTMIQVAGAGAEEPKVLRAINAEPVNWAQIEQVIKPGSGSPETNIPANIEAAQCGGWDLDQQVFDVLGSPGKVASVEGVPGREGQPLEDIKSGMAVKDQNALYPGSTSETCGFMSACRPYAPDPHMMPNFYRDQGYYPNGGQLGPCQRPLGNGEEGAWVDSAFEDSCGDKCCDTANCVPQSGAASTALKFSCGGGDMKAVQDDTVDFCTELQDHGLEGGLCYKLNNDWAYTLWARPHFLLDSTDFDRDGDTEDYIHAFWFMSKGDCRKRSDHLDEDEDPQPDQPKPGWWDNPKYDYDAEFGHLGGSMTSAETGNDVDWEPWEFRPNEDRSRYCCTDQVIQDPLSDSNGNCRTCVGDTCRQGETFDRIPAMKWYCVGFNTPSPPASCLSNTTEATYASFFRRYESEFERAPVDGVPDDVHETENPIPVSCYGVWDPDFMEFDPMLYQTPIGYLRCVIAGYYEENTPFGGQDFHERPDTQMAKGEHQFTRDDPAGGINDGVRKTFDKSTDLWKLDFQNTNAFSLLNGEKLREDYDNDLSIPLLSLDTARQRTGVPLDMERDASGALMNLYSSGFLLRAFDDTGQVRGVATWWQEQQSMAHRLFAPPVVKLVLPSSWSVGLDPLEPIFTPDLPYVNDPGWDDNPLEQPIEVQLEMREDLLDQVARYLESSLSYEFREQKIPVVVPMASATQLRALAQGWCTWDMARTDKTTCESSDVERLLNQIDQYIVQLEKVRTMRSVMPNVIAGYLSFNKGVQGQLNDWILANKFEYDSYLQEREDRLKLQGAWGQAQSLYITFHDKSNQPWCRNDRFTLPVYSLLDPWLAQQPIRLWRRNGYQQRDLEGDLPKLEVEPIPDVVLDFSHLSFSGSSVITVPVMEPIQVRLDLRTLAAPPLNQLDVTVPTLPDLPDPPLITDVWQPPQTGSGSTGALMNLPTVAAYVPSISVSSASTTINQIIARINSMKDIYERFWNSIMIDPADIWDGTEEDCYTLNERQSYGAGDKNPGRCVHLEQDLIERLTRIAARPGIFLWDDLQSTTGSYMKPYVSGFQECAPEDWVCLQFNEQLSYPRIGWQITSSGAVQQDAKLDDLRWQMLLRSLQLACPLPARFHTV